jgi:hypothetical protein
MTSASFVPTMNYYKNSFKYNVLLNRRSSLVAQVATFFPFPYEMAFQVVAKGYILFFRRNKEAAVLLWQDFLSTSYKSAAGRNSRFNFLEIWTKLLGWSATMPL